jgi:glutathione S-transferase
MDTVEISMGSMKLELMSHPLCPYVHRAAIMLAEKGVAFSRRDVDLKNKPDWFLELSPRGKVPVLVADGQPLFESSAINEFLDETHPPRLLPEEPFERARQRGWVEVANDTLVAQYAVLTAPAGSVAGAIAKLDPILDRLAAALAAGTIAENEFGLVQIALAPALHRFVIAEDVLGARLLERIPGVAAFARRTVARPSVTSTVAPDFAERFVASLVERGTSFARA